MRNYLFLLFVFIFFNAYGQTEKKDSLLTIAIELDSLADQKYELGDDSAAIAIGKRLLIIKEIIYGIKHIEYAKTLTNIAKYTFEHGDYDNAYSFIERSLSIIDNLTGHLVEKSEAYLTLADIFTAQGKFKDALWYYKEASYILKSAFGDKNIQYANSLYSLAECYYEYGMFTNAKRTCEDAHNIYVVNNDTLSSEYAAILTSLSKCYYSLGYSGDAVKIALKSAELFKRLYGDNHPSYAASLSCLCVCYSELGDYDKAATLTRQTLDIYRMQYGETHPYYITSLINLATIYYDIGKYDECISITKNVLSLHQKDTETNQMEYFNAYDWLAQSYIETKDYDNALQIAQYSLEQKETIYGKKSIDYANSLSQLAQCYSFIGDNKKAVLLGKKAFKICKKFYDSSHPISANILDQISTYFSDMHKYDKALKYGKEAIRSFSRYAIRNFQGMTSRQRSLLWNRINHRFHKFVGLAYRNPNEDTLNEIYNTIALFSKGILLNTDIDLNNIIHNSGDTALINRYLELKSLTELYNSLIDMPIGNRSIDTDSLFNITQNKEAELIDMSKDYRDFVPKLNYTWRDVQKALKETDIAIVFLDFPLNNDSIMYAAMTIRKEYTSPRFIPLFEINNFKSIPERTYYNRSGLSRLIWEPLKEELQGVENIYFSPTGVLHKIGVEYLPIDDSNKMCDLFNIYRLSSTRQLILKENDRCIINKVALYGGIDYDTHSHSFHKNEISDGGNIKNIGSIPLLRNTFEYLEGTKTEADTIALCLDQYSIPYIYFSGSDGNEESFKNLSGKRINIIHIATHGFYLKESDIIRNIATNGREHNSTTMAEDRPLTRSGLLFSGCNKTIKDGRIYNGLDDGILTAQEIAILDFRGLDLVVLSACETGLGDISSGEGVFGLQRGFKKAGANTIVMSLWKVPDKATEILMTSFYHNYLKGMSKSEAFSKAREEVRKISSPRQTRPDWAAFIMLDGIN